MGGVYIIIGDQTLPKGGIIGDQTLPKGGVSPRKVPPPSHTSYWISSIGQCSHSVQSSNIGSMACNIFKLQELLWPHPPDVQACTSVNSCSSYTVYGIGQGRDLPLPPPIHPLVCP